MGRYIENIAIHLRYRCYRYRIVSVPYISVFQHTDIELVTTEISRVATFQTTWNSLTYPVAWTGKDYRYTAQRLNSRCFTLIITSIVTNLLKATRVSMMNISKKKSRPTSCNFNSSARSKSKRQISVSLTFPFSVTFPWPLWNSLTFPGEWPPWISVISGYFMVLFPTV